MTREHQDQRQSSTVWKSISQLSQEGFSESINTIRSRALKLREDLFEKQISEGRSEAEAKEYIESTFIRNRTGGISLSSEAIPLLSLTHPPDIAAKNWRSASKLVSHDGIKGPISSVSAKFSALQRNLVSDIVASGSAEDEAAVLVDHNLIGKRRTGGGKETAVYASPDALRILTDEGQLPSATRRSKPTGRGK